MKFLKEKAIFLIFIIVYAIFSIQLIQPVQAQENKVCCEKTSSTSPFGEDSCIYTESENCDPDPLLGRDGTACEQTDYCGSGCCIIEGSCNKNTPRATCLEEGGNWHQGIECEISLCQKGCCQLPAECSFVPQAQCAEEIQIFETLTLAEVFDPSLTSEYECQQQCLAIEEGCCVSSNDCSFTSRGLCTGQDSQFFKDRICSSIPSCLVTAQHHTGCEPGKDEVYWYDSDNNRENIYGTPYDSSGLVIPKDQSCDPTENNADNPYCGNCNYALGTICTEADTIFLSNIPSEFQGRVNHMCISLECSSTIDKSNINPWMDGSSRKNQESWCEYEGAVGQGQGLVGSRHYRHLCVNGREIVESCDNSDTSGRENICVQGEIPNSLIQQDETATGTQSAAICRPNLYGLCSTCNDPNSEEFNKYTLNETERNSITCGGECNVYCDEGSDGICQEDEIYTDEEGNSLSSQLKECCNNQALRQECCADNFGKDCYWNDAVNMCAPSFPPGKSDSCETVGEVNCKEVWHRQGLVGDWKCKENCESDSVGKCYSEEYVSSINRYCRSWGDCGAHYNVEGKFTRTGFSISGPSPVDHLVVYDVLGLELGRVNLKDPKDPTQDPWINFNSQAQPINGSFFLAAYVANLLFSINPPENIREFTNDFEDWLWTLGPSIAILTTTFIISLFVAEIGFIPAVIELITLTQANAIALTGGWTFAGAIGGLLLWTGIIVAIIYILFFFGGETQEITYTYGCQAWQPPISGQDCEKCMDYSKCDQYKCESLGSLCEFINQDGEGICVVSQDANDVTAPIISPLPISPRTIDDFTLTPPTSGIMGGYEFKDLIPVYTPLEIGIKTLDIDGTPEYAHCKISKFHKDYDEMTNWFGNNFDSIEHIMEIPVAFEAIPPDQDIIAINPGQLNTFYVRCENRNSIHNEADYFIKFTVEDSPDLTAPILEDPKFSIQNNAFIPYGTTQLDLTIYLDGPADPINGGCKYSTIQNQRYEDMTNNFACPQTPTFQNLYTCTTTLTGLQNNKDNAFYFKCRDRNNNINDDDIPLEGYHLLGTIPLEIADSGPSGTIFSNINQVELTIETENGANLDGTSICYYSFTDFFEPPQITFSNTRSNLHSTLVALQQGSHTLYAWCRDIAGNEDTTEISFVLEADTTEPQITKIYEDTSKIPSKLHISTDEPSTCQYSITSPFIFGKGINMPVAETTEHEAPWGSTVYYILCEDLFNNLSPLIIVYP